jgi:type VI protein secretion system component VasK
MHEPLLERIRQLEHSARRWRIIALVLLLLLLSVFVAGATFVGVLGFRHMRANAGVLRAVQEAREQELRARDEVVAAQRRAEEALQEAKKRKNDNP